MGVLREKETWNGEDVEWKKAEMSYSKGTFPFISWEIKKKPKNRKEGNEQRTENRKGAVRQ